MTLWELFLVFLQVGTFSVGGGYAAMPLIQALTVDTHGWLTLSEFADLVTIAEMTPGPIAINSATFIGVRLAGFPGVAAAVLGCILPSLVIVTLLSWLYSKYSGGRVLTSTLSALRPVVVALIAAAALALSKLAFAHWAGIALFVLAFAVLRWKKCNPILVMGCCGVIGAVLHSVGIW